MAKKPSVDDINLFHSCGLYIPTRTIYVGSDLESTEDGVNSTMAARVAKNLSILSDLGDENISVILNTPGGNVNHGLAIYDLIKSCKSHVTITAYGYVMSMGSVILQAADVRVMSPTASQMLHYGDTEVSGEEKTVMKDIEESKRVNRWMEKMYLSKIKEKQPLFKLGRLQKMLDRNTYLTPQQSVDLGLADKVLE